MICKRYHCSVPASIIEDTIRKDHRSLKRDKYRLFQTPQIFNLKYFLKSIKKIKNKPTDDLGVIENNKGIKINYVDINKLNIKITKKNDIQVLKNIMNYNTRYGNGFDIHKLTNGNYLSLAGLKIKSKFRAVGHSDGDVVIHSIIDALLGTNNKGDIGKYFPATKEYKNISSVILLNKIKKTIKLESCIISNLDCTIICQKVRLEKYKVKIRRNLALLLGCSIKNINIKAKTADNVGSLGKSKAIACWTAVKLIKI